METIVTLIVVGCILLFFEVVFPSGILALLSFFLLLGSVWMGFDLWGPLGGVANLVVVLVAVGLTVYAELRYMPNTKLGKKFLLSGSSQSTSIPATLKSIVGQEGVTSTPLNPSGKIEIDGQIFEAQTLDSKPMSTGQIVIVKGATPHALVVIPKPDTQV